MNRLRRKFSSTWNEKWMKYNIYAVCMAFILISALSIGYSAVIQAVEVRGFLSVRSSHEVRVNNVVNLLSSCGTDVYNPRYTEDSVIVNGNLPSLNCTLEYEVTIKNTTDYVMEIMDIDDTVYNNPDIVYEIVGIDVGDTIDANSEKVGKIIFKYKSNVSVLPELTEIGAILEFEFDYYDVDVYEMKFVENGLVLLYDGQNNSGDGYSSDTHIWKDLIGNNDGILAGNPMWGDGYLNFDGIDDKVRFIGDIPLNYTIVITFEPTFNDVTSWQRLFSENPFPSLYVNNASGIRNMRLYGHGIDSIFPSSTIEEEKMQAAITFDGNNIELYINGKFISDLKTTSNPASVPIACLGGRIIDNNRQFEGKIYNFMIYDRVLGEEEIFINSEVIISDYFIPIRTVGNFLKIASDETVVIDSSEYIFSPNAKYVVENNLNFSYEGIFNPTLANGSVITNDKIVTITNTLDNSIHYYQNGYYTTEDNAILDGIVLHYDSKNNTGSGYNSTASIWKDLVGSNDGVLNNGPIWDGYSLKFDGVNDNVRYVGSITQEYSFVITFKPTVLSGSHPRLFAENPYPSLYLHSGNSYQLGFYGQGKDNVFLPSRTPLLNKPTYVVVTYSSNVVTLYANGIMIGKLTGLTNPTSAAWAYLGGRSTNDRQYSGKIYDFIIYNRVLDDMEIRMSSITNEYKYRR